MRKYLDFTALPPIPASADWSKPVKKWTVMGNNSYGDCVFAGRAHMIQTWSANKGHELIIPDDDVVQLYLKYSPGDDGYNIADSLKILRQTGMWGRNIWSYCSVDPHDHDAVKAAIHLFGGLATGVNLPRGWQSADVWDVGGGRPGSWGGHDVPIIAYDDKYLTCVTWGALQKITWAGWDYYFDESYACIAPDWFTGGTAPNGLDLENLRADLVAVTD
jgi:hypothetical protein